ncbi:lysoplasmalogenase [Prauserella aidingensis]|uniref:lysoplasmalogenase n=1 Tax=Prauserella aidingensis TaxID=387890 RepID=UPI0020A3F1BA|nr:lysoplasmalogenase [Prauserella aidingensis]
MPAVVFAVAYAAVAVVHLVVQVTGPAVLSRPTQVLLMPLLAGWLWCAAPERTRPVRFVTVALAFSWLGDTLPAAFTGDVAFLAMVGGFLLAQVTYVVAFWPYRHASLLRTPAVAGYLAAFGVLFGLCAPGAGGMLVPVAVYGLCLTSMAVLATGAGRLAGIGGAVFFVSDGLIALGAFADWYDPPAHDLWVMITYLAGQALLAVGVLRAGRLTARTEATAPRSTAPE